jgi:hypothetical protein
MREESQREQSRGLLADYFTEVELARELRKSTRTVKRWRALRSGPPWTQNGKEVLYRIESAREWLRSQQVQPVRERKKAARRRVIGGEA